MDIDNEVTDVDIISEVTTENANAVLVSEGVPEATESPQISREQIAAYMEYMHKKHNSQCRKKGFKDHFHQPAGSKIGRALLNNGSVYGPMSIVSQAFNDIRTQAWKDAGKTVAYHERGKVIAVAKAVTRASREEAKKVANKSAVVA